MLCEACGNENRTGSRFCDRCGSPLSLSCPACGEPNRGDAAFCASCGAGLHADTNPEPAQPVAERRQVSVLFVDLVGFTRFADGRDPERVRALQQRYFERATDAIQRHGGTVEKFVGDAVMAVWGTPIAHEDDAQRAIRGALEVVDGVSALGHDLAARAGVVTGEAAVTLGATNQGMVAGDMVNTAARLQTVASPTHVLVDQATMQAAHAAVAFEPIDELELKGKEGPVRAWRAVRVQPRAGDLVKAPFVGRGEELRRLKDLMHATTRDRRIRLASIVGPAGIGKSRLVEELGSYADGLADTIFWHIGRSPSYGAGLAFWALGEMVRRRAGLAEGDDDATTRARIGEAVGEFVPSEEEREWIAPALLSLLGVGTAISSESLYPAWRTFFERIAGRGCAVLVFEDLQWADSGTIEFIEHLIDWSRNHPILVITLARPELLESHAGWGTGRTNATAMTLDSLPAAEMGALLAGLLPGLPEEQLQTIVLRAEGVPLYAVEMVRALLEEGRIERRGDAFAPTGDLGDLPLPASLRSLIASRLDTLEPDDRALLQHGSVLGQAFSLEALGSVTGQEASAIERRLKGLVRRELLEIEADPRSPERGQYRFLQSLIREVAYDTLALRERRSRHLAAARFLEASESEEAAGALASHYLEAYRASDDGPEADAVAVQARIALRSAAERASSLGAHAQAVHGLVTALSITDAPAERAELLERARDAAVLGGLGSGPDFARQAVVAWETAGDERRGGRAKALLGEALISESRIDEALEHIERETQALGDDTDPEVAARLYSSLGRVYMRLDRNIEAIEATDRALNLAEPRRIDDVTAHALINRGAALVGLSRSREAAALVREGMAIMARLGVTREEFRAQVNLANILVPDEPLEALALARRGLEKARRLGDVWFIVDFVMFLSGISYCVGTPAAWQEAMETLDALAAEARTPAERFWLYAPRLSFAVARGDDTAGMLEAVRRLPEIEPGNPMAAVAPHFSRAEVALVKREWHPAVAEARAAIELHRFSSQDAGPILVHAATRLGDLESMRWFSHQLDAHAFVGAQPAAVRRRVRGAIRAAEGNAGEAVDAFAEALDTYSSLGLRWEWARTALDALAALPRDGRVRAWAAEGRSTFEDIGASAYVALTDDLLGAGADDGPTGSSRNPALDERMEEAQTDGVSG